MEWAIGITNQKHHCTNSNPYAGSKHLGKQAKLDMLSANANRHAHAYVPPSATVPAFPSTCFYATDLHKTFWYFFCVVLLLSQWQPTCNKTVASQNTT